MELLLHFVDSLIIKQIKRQINHMLPLQEKYTVGVTIATTYISNY